MTSGAPSPAGVLAVDITGGERRLGVRVHSMQKVAEQFARGARRSLPFLARRKARLIAGETGAGKLAALQADAGPLCQVVLEASGRTAWAALRLDVGAIQLIVDGSLGGAAPEEGEGHEPPPLLSLTLAQRALVARVARALGADFVEALQEHVGSNLTVVKAECLRAEDHPAMPKDVVATECLFDGISSRASIWLLVAGDLLEAPAPDRSSGSDVRVDPRLAEALQGVPVDVVVELGRVSLGLRRILALRPGEVLRLPAATDDPIPVRVGGLTKLYGVPVVSRGQISVQITGRHGA